VKAPWTPPGARVSCDFDDGTCVLAIHVGDEVVKLGVHPMMPDWSGPWLWMLCRAWGAHDRARAAVPYDLSEPSKEPTR
jgi:hypothetical protein